MTKQVFSFEVMATVFIVIGASNADISDADLCHATSSGSCGFQSTLSASYDMSVIASVLLGIGSTLAFATSCSEDKLAFQLHRITKLINLACLILEVIILIILPVKYEDVAGKSFFGDFKSFSVDVSIIWGMTFASCVGLAVSVVLEIIIDIRIVRPSKAASTGAGKVLQPVNLAPSTLDSTGYAPPTQAQEGSTILTASTPDATYTRLEPTYSTVESSTPGHVISNNNVDNDVAPVYSSDCVVYPMVNV